MTVDGFDDEKRENEEEERDNFNNNNITTRKEQRILHYLNEREFERTGGFTSGLFRTSHCVLSE